MELNVQYLFLFLNSEKNKNIQNRRTVVIEKNMSWRWKKSYEVK